MHINKPYGYRELLFTGHIPRGVFCEWSAAEVTENPRIAAGSGRVLSCLVAVEKMPPVWYTGAEDERSHRHEETPAISRPGQL